MKRKDIIRTRGYKTKNNEFFDDLKATEKNTIEGHQAIHIYGEEEKTVYMNGREIKIEKQPIVIKDKDTEEITTWSSAKIDGEIKKITGKNKEETTKQITTIKENLVGIANAINVSYDHIEELQQSQDNGYEGLQADISQVVDDVNKMSDGIKEEIKLLSDMITENEKANEQDHIAINEEIKTTNNNLEETSQEVKTNAKATSEQLDKLEKKIGTKTDGLFKNIEKVKESISLLVTREDFFTELAVVKDELENKSVRGHKHEIADISGLSAILKKLQKSVGNTTTILSKVGGVNINDINTSKETTYSSEKIEEIVSGFGKLLSLQGKSFYVDTIVNNQITEGHREDTTTIVNTYNGSNKLITAVYTLPDTTTITLTITYDVNGNLSTALYS